MCVARARKRISETEGKGASLLVVLRDVRVRAVCVCSGRLSAAESMKYRPAVLNNLCSGNLIGQMERGDVIGQDGVSLNA